MKLVRKLSRRNEKGQVLVILALALVALFGFAGLAIDGTRVYEARRQNQSTADSAALTAAGVAQNVIKEAQPEIFFCGDSQTALTRIASDQGVTSAQISAKQDGIALARYDITTNGITSICETDGKRTYMDFIAKVTTSTDTTFARVIGINSLPSTATATVRIYPYQSAAYGNAIASLSNDCGGIDFGGTISLNILKGGVFSNSCINGRGTPLVKVYDGQIKYGTDYAASSVSADITPHPEPTTERLATKGLIDDPPCPTSGYSAPPSSGVGPGAYTGINVANNEILNLAPGLYCLKGNLNVAGQGTLNAPGVVFAFLEGGPTFAGGATLNLSAPSCPDADPDCSETIPDGLDETTKYLRGVLMFSFFGNPSPIRLEGNSVNNYQGMIYAPSAQITITGTSDSNTFNTQLIGLNVAIEGNANLTMDQDSKDTFHYQSSVEVRK